jgi:hypothetical protein
MQIILSSVICTCFRVCTFSFPFYSPAPLVCMSLCCYTSSVRATYYGCSQSQSISHITIGDQAISLGVEPLLGLVTRYYFLFDSYCFVYVGRPLWREVGSLLSVSVSNIKSIQNFYLHITCSLCFMYIQGICQPRLGTADHAPAFVAYAKTTVYTLEQW